MEFDTGTGKLYGAIVAELSSYAGRAISSTNLMMSSKMRIEKL